MVAAKIQIHRPVKPPSLGGKGGLAPRGTGDFGAMLDVAKATVTGAGDSSSKTSAVGAMANATGAKPQAAAVSGADLLPRAMPPISVWDQRPGVKAPTRALGELQTERHPAGPMAPIVPADSIPGVRKSAKERESEVDTQARKWVAQTFYGTLFKQMRSSPFKSNLFDGGRGGQAFAPMLDQHLIDHMGKGSAKRLTAAIAKRLMGKQAGSSAKPQAAGTIAEDQTRKLPAGDAPQQKQQNEAPTGYEGVRFHVAPSLRA